MCYAKIALERRGELATSSPARVSAILGNYTFFLGCGLAVQTGQGKVFLFNAGTRVSRAQSRDQGREQEQERNRNRTSFSALDFAPGPGGCVTSI